MNFGASRAKALDKLNYFIENNLSEYSNFGYIPLYEKLNRSKQDGNSLRWKYDSHLNELGNQIFADSMFDYIENQLN